MFEISHAHHVIYFFFHNNKIKLKFFQFAGDTKLHRILRSVFFLLLLLFVNIENKLNFSFFFLFYFLTEQQQQQQDK